METVVGIGPETIEGERRVLDSREKTEPIQIRAEGISQADELIEAFNQARQPKQQVAALEQIAKFHQQFKEPEKQLQSVITTIENVATRNQKLHPELAFELVLHRDD